LIHGSADLGIMCLLCHLGGCLGKKRKNMNKDVDM
jgi:hypothetical protein